jgi:hypothetical protein
LTRPFIDQSLLVEKVVYRQQVEGGDAKPPEMLDHRRRGETGVAAAQDFGNPGMLSAHPLDVRFVEHRVRQGVAGGESPSQSKRFVHHGGGQQCAPGRRVPARKSGRRLRAHRGRAAGAWPSKRWPFHGVVRAMHPVGVAQSGRCTGEVAVPDLIGALAQRQHAHLSCLREAQLDPLGMGREEREVDSAAVPVGAERPGPPGFETPQSITPVHSKYSPASGGSVRFSDQVATVRGTCSAWIGSKPLPTLLPP